jgi:xanthine dehydrogenase accessory factor
VAKDILDVMLEMRALGRPYAVATVVETQGSVSAKTGAKAVIDHEGRVVAGWVGGGCAESTTCYQALQCIAKEQTALVDIDMNDEVLGVGMPCGGSMRVYVEPILPKPTLWLMGHGRVAECLCLLGDLMGLAVVANDPLVTADKYPAASRLITHDAEYAELTPLQGDFVVIATQHKGDHRSMQRALRSNAGYIALIASRKRSRLVLEYLRKEGFSEEDLVRVRAPAGLDLGARTPEEIALCVISEMVLVRRHAGGMPMRDALREPPERVAAVGQ